MTKTYKKITGNWIPIKKIFKNISGTWIEIKKVFQKVNGTWQLVHSGAVEYTFTQSITATTSTGILLSDYVNPNSAEEFIITIDEGVVLQGKQGNNGYNGAHGSPYMYYANCRYGANAWGNGQNGGTGGAGGYGMNLAGFEGKKITFVGDGTIKGGNGGNGGRGGNAMSGGNACSTNYGGCGGAGGAGGSSIINNQNVNVIFSGISSVSGSKGANGLDSAVPIYVNNCNSSCFIKGQLVLMADGTYLPIEDIRVGDKVQGAYGPSDINTVVYLQRPPRGDRIIYDICNLLVSDEHGILNGNRDGFLFLDMENHYAEQNMYQTCLDENFKEIQVWFSGPQDGITKKEDLVIGSKIASSTGFKIVEDIIPTDIQDETLYHLVLDGGSRTYCISDVFVSGYTDDKLFDYEKGELRK